MYVGGLNFEFCYMYLSTEYLYDYDDWSSYFVAWGLDLHLIELNAKFGICWA